MKPAVSWIIPVKNGEKYLSETLRSLECQSFQDFQVLVWDNGSTDATISILNEWIPSRLPGVVYAENPLTIGGALAELVRRSNTEFCARIDSDDIAQPDRLRQQTKFLRANPQVALVGTCVEIITTTGQKTGQQINYPLNFRDILNHLLHANPIAHPSVLFRTQAVLDVGNYSDNQIYEDYDLWLRLAKRYSFANLPESYLYYRTHSDSVMSRILSRDSIHYQAFDLLLSSYASLYCLPPEIAQCLRNKQLGRLPCIAYTIAKQQSLRRGSPVFSELTARSLGDSLSHLTPVDSIATRFFLRMLSLNFRALYIDIREFARQRLFSS